ncbi:metal ABC transporter solute-binding protein, Zn/Mn family [Bermanella sp. R86510]|uniref:metal ABC transporter solute-binding protein, Zn/Mn family n=1 Tax=unclassified Bermanella TaxID=2627862 RepID=UPI0037C65A9D
MYKPVLAALLVVLFSQSLHAQEQSEQPIMASLHPVALLIKSAWPNQKVEALMQANQSPHDFSLRPSDLSRLQQAKGLVWSGAKFEPYLVELASDKQQVDLSLLLSSHDSHAHDHGHDHGHNNESEVPHDPHYWLNPREIKHIISGVQKQFGLPEPSAFLSSYDAWLNVAKQQLKPHTGKGFVSFHDAFVDWVRYFNLSQLDKVTLHPEQPVGTRHLLNIRDILQSGEASCLFVEPQFKSRLVQRLTQGIDIKQVNIDPLASSFKINDANFLQYYNQLLERFSQCFRSN